MEEDTEEDVPKKGIGCFKCELYLFYKLMFEIISLTEGELYHLNKFSEGCSHLTIKMGNTYRVALNATREKDSSVIIIKYMVNSSLIAQLSFKNRQM